MSFNALTRFCAGMDDSVVNVATWARACTPASVRPEPCGKTFSPVTRPIAEASVPWMVAASGCTCHPENSEPSYANTSLRLRMRMPGVLARLHVKTVASLCKFDAVSWSAAESQVLRQLYYCIPHDGYDETQRLAWRTQK